MGDRTKIAWTNATWNPVVGCTKVSPGCASCYAVRSAWRMAHNPEENIGGLYAAGLVQRHQNGQLDWTGKAICLTERLDQPLHWRRPRRVFVCSMSDLFHEQVPDEFIERVFSVMAVAQQHTFQVLTKRPERMLQWFERKGFASTAESVCWWGQHLDVIWDARGSKRENYSCVPSFGRTTDAELMKRRPWPGWPLPNVWLGVSCEDQRRADERTPLLLQAPAAERFVSLEPLLGPISLDRWLHSFCQACAGAGTVELRDEIRVCPDCLGSGQKIGPALSWVIVGCESGPHARPMNEDWVRAIRDQCQAAGVPFFYKQAMRNGKLISTPTLDGRAWVMYPRQEEEAKA